DHHVGRLVDDGEVLVLVEHLERDVLGDGQVVGGRRQLDADFVFAADAVAGLDRLAVDEDVAGLDGLLKQGAGKVGELNGEVGVEPAARGFAPDDQLDNVVNHVREGVRGQGSGVSRLH